MSFWSILVIIFYLSKLHFKGLRVTGLAFMAYIYIEKSFSNACFVHVFEDIFAKK